MVMDGSDGEEVLRYDTRQGQFGCTPYDGRMDGVTGLYTWDGERMTEYLMGIKAISWGKVWGDGYFQVFSPDAVFSRSGYGSWLLT